MMDPKLKTYITGLLLSCPLYDAQEDCPLEDKRRSLSLVEKFQFVEQLDLESVMNIIELHKSCAFKRQNLIKSNQIKAAITGEKYERI